MKKYIVIGNPIEHSLSPKLHNYWIKENNIDAVYDKKQLNETDIKRKNIYYNFNFIFNIDKSVLWKQRTFSC